MVIIGTSSRRPTLTDGRDKGDGVRLGLALYAAIEPAIRGADEEPHIHHQAAKNGVIAEGVGVDDDPVDLRFAEPGVSGNGGPDRPDAKILVVGPAGPADHAAFGVEVTKHLFEAGVIDRIFRWGGGKPAGGFAIGPQVLEVGIASTFGEDVEHLGVAWRMVKRGKLGA